MVNFRQILLCTAPCNRCFCFDIFTARKPGLEQGNVFTPVCHSVHRGSWLPSMHHRSHNQGGLPPWGSASREGLHRGGSASRRGWADPPLHHGILWETVNKRAVRILLVYAFLLKRCLDYCFHFSTSEFN